MINRHETSAPLTRTWAALRVAKFANTAFTILAAILGGRVGAGSDLNPATAIFGALAKSTKSPVHRFCFCIRCFPWNMSVQRNK